MRNNSGGHFEVLFYLKNISILTSMVLLTNSRIVLLLTDYL